jgi:hypothetical protein
MWCWGELWLVAAAAAAAAAAHNIMLHQHATMRLKIADSRLMCAGVSLMHQEMQEQQKQQQQITA